MLDPMFSYFSHRCAGCSDMHVSLVGIRCAAHARAKECAVHITTHIATHKGPHQESNHRPDEESDQNADHKPNLVSNKYADR